jgi:hypothetical protein
VIEDGVNLFLDPAALREIARDAGRNTGEPSADRADDLVDDGDRLLGRDQRPPLLLELQRLALGFDLVELLAGFAAGLGVLRRFAIDLVFDERPDGFRQIPGAV